MRGTAAAGSAMFTATRTSSEPASASALTCVTVASMSAVSVLVIDWTTIGEPPPTGTPPIIVRWERRRRMGVRLRALIECGKGTGGNAGQRAGMERWNGRSGHPTPARAKAFHFTMRHPAGRYAGAAPRSGRCQALGRGQRR